MAVPLHALPSPSLGIAWAFFAVFFLIMMLVSYLIVRHYSDPHEAHPLTTLVASVTLSLTFLSMFLVPVDIYAVSSSKDPLTGHLLLSHSQIQSRGEAIRAAYYVIYSLLLFCTFVLVPFAYFYYEEEEEEESTVTRCTNAFRYTVLFGLVAVILLVLGLIMYSSGPVVGHEEEWMMSVFDSHDSGDAAIEFAVACLIVGGLFGLVFYTAMGLAWFPIATMKGVADNDGEINEIGFEIDQVKGKQGKLKSISGRRQMTRKEKTTLRLLESEERVLLRKQELALKRSPSQCYRWCRPCRVFAGLSCLVVTTLIVVSFTMTTADRGLNSEGAASGFTLTREPMFNPMDRGLLALSHHFPADYMATVGITVYIFAVTVCGISRLGVRFLWITLYRLKNHASAPQALLLMVIITAFIMLAMSMEMLTLGPQYASFGNQVVHLRSQRDPVPCAFAYVRGSNHTCTMTQIAVFVNRITLQFRFFSIAFYAANWLFIGLFIIWSTWTLLQGDRNMDGPAYSTLDQDDEEDGLEF